MPCGELDLWKLLAASERALMRSFLVRYRDSLKIFYKITVRSYLNLEIKKNRLKILNVKKKFSKLNFKKFQKLKNR